MDSEKLVNFFFEINCLKRLTRSHRQFITGVTDNIADHSFRVTVIGMILAELEGADQNKVMKMCLFHDLAESRTGDLNHLNKQYMKSDEESASKDQLEDLPISTQIREILEEYEKRESKESIVAKDADLIEQMVLQQDHFYRDPTNHKVWQDYTEKIIQTESAKKLAKKVKETNPISWHYRALEKKTGVKID